MPKRAAVNVAMPLEFTLFTPTYRLVAHYFDDEPEPGRLEWQLQHLCAAR